MRATSCCLPIVTSCKFPQNAVESSVQSTPTRMKNPPTPLASPGRKRLTGRGEEIQGHFQVDQRSLRIQSDIQHTFYLHHNQDIFSRLFLQSKGFSGLPARACAPFSRSDMTEAPRPSGTARHTSWTCSPILRRITCRQSCR